MIQDQVNVMIVDDESIFREYLVKNIDWEFLGLQVCCEAKNGVEAYELAMKNRPDIALIDINMPVMDGLELSEKLKETYPETVIILITGHSEFEYARKAVKLGVTDYILKPFEDEELIGILMKTKSAIVKNREQKSISQSNMTLVRERLLNMLISNDCSTDEVRLKKQLEYAGIHTGSLAFYVATVEIDNLYQKWNDPKEIELWLFAVSNILEEAIKTDGTHTVFNGPEGRIISLVEINGSQGTVDLKDSGYEEFCRLVDKYLRFTVTVGVGNVFEGFRGIRNSYLESLAALQNKFTLGNNQVIRYSDLSNESMSIGFYPNEINEDVIINLRTNHWTNAKNKLDEVFDYIRRKRLSQDYTFTICSGLISLCLSYLTETGHDIGSVFGENFKPFSEMRKKESLDILQDWIISLFQRTVQHCGGGKNTRSRKIADAAMEYINRHYSDSELCLEKIAGNLYIHPDYLRAAFKKETSMTLSDYITNYRMKKAKELLAMGNIKLLGVSEMVGYSDASYFSKCFKKYYGISPSEYANGRQ